MAKIICSLTLFIFFGKTMFSQEMKPVEQLYTEYKKKLPAEPIVYLDYSTTNTFEIIKNKVVVKTIVYEKILYLDNKAQFFSKGSVWYNQHTEVKNISAVCYYPVNGKYKKEIVKDFKEEQMISDGVSFYDERKKISFSYPYLREAAYTELTYEIIHKIPQLLYPQTFSYHAYMVNETFTIKAQKHFDIGYLVSNNHNNDIKYTQSTKGDFNIYTWKLENAPKKSFYGDDDYYMHYLPQVIPYIKSYVNNNDTTNVFRNVADLYNWYVSLLKEVKPISNNKLKSLSDSLTRNLPTKIDKISAVYNWVQDNIKYIAFGDGLGGFVPRNPDNIFEKRFGDCKDMSCIAVHLLKEVDIKVYPTWVGTRIIPYSYYHVYTPQVDNHMIVTYIDEKNNKTFLDATHSNLDYGLPSPFIQGKEVLISIDENTFEIDTVPIMPAAKSVEIDTNYLSISGNSLIGSGKMHFTGYLAFETYEKFYTTKASDLLEKFKKEFEKGSNKFKPQNVKFLRPNNSKNLTQFEYDFTIDDYVKTIENDMFINLNLNKQLLDLKIEKKQNIPNFFDFKNQTNKCFILEIPENYSIYFLPENVEITSDLMDFKIEYKQIENKIYYHFFYSLNTIKLDIAEFEKWNTAIDKLVNAFDESIILSQTKK